MTYSPTEPQDFPPPVVATAQIKTNFQQFQTAFSSNHTALNKSNQGKHEKVIFEQQALDPLISSAFVAMYAKSVTNAVGTQPQGFIRIPQFLPNEVPNAPEQITYNTVNTTGPQYHSFLPGGYVMYFGMITSLVSPIVPVTITLNPACSSIVCIVVNGNNVTTGTNVGIQVLARNITTNSFIIDSTNSGFATPPIVISWTAIGIQ